MNAIELQPGQRVEVNWGEQFGWLPGTFRGYTTGDADENFNRCMVSMDNGFACNAPGYHPDCVRQA